VLLFLLLVLSLFGWLRNSERIRIETVILEATYLSVQGLPGTITTITFIDDGYIVKEPFEIEAHDAKVQGLTLRQDQLGLRFKNEMRMFLARNDDLVRFVLSEMEQQRDISVRAHSSHLGYVITVRSTGKGIYYNHVEMSVVYDGVRLTLAPDFMS
jgi:hypothetical protein